MSRERQRARAARDAAKAQQRARAERDRARRQARQRRVQKVKAVVPARRRRLGGLPGRVRLGLALFWLLVQFLAWQVVHAPAQRVGVAILALFALPLIVVVLYNPARRYR